MEMNNRLTTSLFLGVLGIYSICDVNKKENYPYMTKLETIEVISSNTLYKGPLRVIFFFISNPLFLNTVESWNKDQWIGKLGDLHMFQNNIKPHLAMAPVVLEMVNNSVSQTLLVHHNKRSIIGMVIVAVSPDGTNLFTLVIPGEECKNSNVQNLIIIIEDGKIKAQEGIYVKS